MEEDEEHAEEKAIKIAFRELQTNSLEGCKLFISCQPC